MEASKAASKHSSWGVMVDNAAVIYAEPDGIIIYFSTAGVGLKYLSLHARTTPAAVPKTGNYEPSICSCGPSALEIVQYVQRGPSYDLESILRKGTRP